MSFVYFLDVFDASGLPPTLPAKAAADQLRGQRLAAPNGKLVQLLARIHERRALLEGATVNVVGGADGEPVHWVEGAFGATPMADGSGAICSLWTLIIPLEEGDELEKVMPTLSAWAQELGLSVYDAQAEGLDPSAAPPATPVATGATASPVSKPAEDGQLDGCEIMVYSRFAFLGCTMSSVGEVMQRVPGMSVRQAMEKFTVGLTLEGTYGAPLRRLVQRLLQSFPWETQCEEVWCGRHPLTDPAYQSDGVRVLKVSRAHLEPVLQRLLPLARELFLSVAVPDLDLFVDRGDRPSDFKAQPMDKLAELDPAWMNHRLDEKKLEAQLRDALAKLLAPHGFLPLEEKGAYRFAFVRPLSQGGGRQVVSYHTARGLEAEVQSERLLAVLLPVGWPGELGHACVVQLKLGQERGKDHPDWDGLHSGANGKNALVSMEHIAHALEDFERLIMPSLGVLHTAGDLWRWYQRPYAPPPAFPGFSNESAVFAWLADEESRFTISREAMYSARYLPDERYIPLLEAWEVSMQPSSGLPFVAISLKCANAFRHLPQTPPDGPL
jgi:hypothetical protein